MITETDYKFIESRSWYQTIEFEPGVSSKGYEWCGELAWQNMRKFMPDSLEDKRILDLGCNAGLFCVKAALMGAKEVVGVDWPGWRPNWNFIEQQQFVKDYFERKYGRKLPIEYLSYRMEDFLRMEGIGYFDYVFGMASLYYTEDPYMVVRRIAEIADNAIVRLRDDSIIDRFRELFKRVGFTEQEMLQEKMWEKLGYQTDDFYMFHFRKEKNLEVFYHRIIKGHEEISGTQDLLDIWQLMELVGTETPIEEFTSQTPQQFITYVPLKKFKHLLDHRYRLNRFVPDPASEEPWDELVQSIKEKGFVVPIIAVEIEEDGEKYYRPLEGKHRIAAVTMIEPLNPDFLIPCVLVEKVRKRA